MFPTFAIPNEKRGVAKVFKKEIFFERELSSVGSERLPYKQRVGGSTPSAPTDLQDSGAVVQLVRIRACHARGRGFESRPHRNKH